jgi:hypothetical protein
VDLDDVTLPLLEEVTDEKRFLLALIRLAIQSLSSVEELEGMSAAKILQAIGLALSNWSP